MPGPTSYDLVQLIANTLTDADPAGNAQYSLVVQDNTLKRAPLANQIGGTIAAQMVINLAAQGFLGYSRLEVMPDTANGRSILIETSRDNATTWDQFGSGPWARRIGVGIERTPDDIYFVTHIRLTPVAGTGVASRWALTNKVVSLSTTQEESRGFIETFDLVVDGTTRIAFPDEQTFRGLCARSVGNFQNIIQIRSLAFGDWAPYTPGRERFFQFKRCSNATVYVEAQPGVDLGASASQAARLAKTRPDLTAVQPGDYTTQGGVVYTLRVAPGNSNGNWIANAAGVPGPVTVVNDTGAEPRLGQLMTVVEFGPNQWALQQ